MTLEVLLPSIEDDITILDLLDDLHDPQEVAAARTKPQQRAEWAILLPRGRWWRKISTRRADPNGRAPSIFHSRGRAEDEMADLRGLLRTDFGLRRRDIPRLRLMVRDVEIGVDGTQVIGRWRPAPAETRTR